MPDIVYENESVNVANEVTTGLDLVQDIAPDDLFVSEADSDGKRYGFDIHEIEDYMLDNQSINNFYTQPLEAFSINDLAELRGRSAKIAAFLSNYVKSCENQIQLISPQTLLQIKLLGLRAGGYPRDREFYEEIKNKYSPDEIAQLEHAGLHIQDVARGEAFDRFKNYYAQLSDAEKDAIDAFPGVQKILKLTRGMNSLRDIFNLPPESCLGGTAGACEAIATMVQNVRDISGRAFPVDLKEQVFTHQQSETAKKRGEQRISEGSSLGMMVVLKFAGIICSKSMREFQGKSEQELVDWLKTVAPRAENAAWCELLKKMLENGNRIAIIEPGIDKGLIEMYLRDVIGIPNELLRQITVLGSQPSESADEVSLITQACWETGNEKLPHERIVFVAASNRSMDYLNVKGYSTYVTSADDFKEGTFLRGLTAKIAGMQADLLLPKKETYLENANKDSGYGDPSTPINDMVSSEPPASEQAQATPDSGAATPKSGKGGKEDTKRVLDGAAVKLSKMMHSGFFQGRAAAKEDPAQKKEESKEHLNTKKQ